MRFLEHTRFRASSCRRWTARRQRDVVQWMIVASAVAWSAGCVVRDARVAELARPVGDESGTSAQVETIPDSGTPAASDMHDITPADASRGLLDAAMSAAEGVRSARMEFHRQERLGIFQSLKPAERMIALCRESPFSVLFTWLDDDSEFSQCLFIEGANENRVLLHRRKGLLGGPGGVVAFPPALGVVFQKAKLPITEFGPRRVMAAIQNRIDAAEAWGGVDVKVRGRAIVGPADELCDHLTLMFPEKDAHAAKRVELYLHAETHLPVMIELWLPDRGDGASDASLDARYLFAGVEINPPLEDGHFELEVLRDETNKRDGASGDRAEPADK